MKQIIINYTSLILFIIGTFQSSYVQSNELLIHSSAAQHAAPQRIISLGGGVTEIIYALGQQDRLVGLDQSSIYPREAQSLPSVGYYRSVPIEGVLRLKPDLVIASEQAGPVHALEQLRSMGLKIESVSDQPELDSLYRRIQQIADLLGVPQRGQLMRDQLEHKLAHSYRYSSHRPSAMMIVMRSGKLLGAGRDTAAAKIMELSSLDNVLNDLKGYRPISAEIVSATLPSAIIVTTFSVHSMGGMNSVREHIALRHAPAAKNGKIVELDDLLAQALGPRLPFAIETIRQGLVEQ